MAYFELTSRFVPTGDQPEAIASLTQGVLDGLPAQTLLGVTGSGKTFTIANVIANVEKPTLILSHNKTLAAQLYSEMKAFFPHNAVEYYVSYYDYYQPEAYIPSTDTYIEKDLAINDEIDRLRLAATSALLSGRRDVIVVSSVSCIYGMGNPAAFYENVINLRRGQSLDRNILLRRLNNSLYTRNDVSLSRGEYRVKGDTVDVWLAYSENLIRISFWDNEVETIEEVEAESGIRLGTFDDYNIYPANLFITTEEQTRRAIHLIEDDLTERVQYFQDIGKPLEAKRLYERVTYDMEMIRELGHCSGIENYSRYFDGRSPGTRPYCLLDFFPKDFLMVIDESHVSVPQIGGMSGGDHARKVNLVEYGFRLPAAIDNRPLTYEEFEALTPQTIYVSATPADFELQRSEGVVVEQVIRPTGLLDPPIIVRPSTNQIDDLMDEINQRIHRGERTLVTTTTKREAEELCEYLLRYDIATSYIHSDVDTLERVRILGELRAGTYHVLVGVNLLREGLDLPEVSLVAILDADKQGFLRDYRSLIQTIGRTARNIHGTAIMYADRISPDMQRAIDETNRRREKQLRYNELHHIIPTQTQSSGNLAAVGINSQHTETSDLQKRSSNSHQIVNGPTPYVEPDYAQGIHAAEQMEQYAQTLSPDELRKAIADLRAQMNKAAQALDFASAISFRNQLFALMAHQNPQNP